MGTARRESAGCFALGVAVVVGGWAALPDETTVSATAAGSIAHRSPSRAVEPEVRAVAPATIAPAPIAARPTDDDRPSTPLGSFRLTRYHVADDDGAGRAEVGIYDDRGCKEIARVSRDFARELDLQGTGRLADGTVVNVWKKACGCQRSPCYRALGDEARWGIGANEAPLEPFRTVAVDPDVVALGSRLYIAELDGLTMPGLPPWGGFVHDGCVVAADVGDGVRGRQVDLFVGRRHYQRALDARRRIETVTVYAAGGRCGENARDSSI